MKHLKTRLGVFWVIETGEDANHQYYLGINDQELGIYQSVDEAVDDVCSQSTGYFPWDCQSRIKVPNTISGWKEGQPENW